MLPQWAAERERDFSHRFAGLGVAVTQPEVIVAHTAIPDANGGPPRKPDEIADIYGHPAYPCMYVYSTVSRWRLADLYYLSDEERCAAIGGFGTCREWLRAICNVLGRSVGVLHLAGGHDQSLSTHNVFIDGTRHDFEYAWLPDLQHSVEAVLNQDSEKWRGRELVGLRNLVWEVAELMRLDVSTEVVTRWWEDAYQAAVQRRPGDVG